jgi:D-alanine transaminase
MGRQAYVNGRFLPKADAYVHIEDRGYQLADGVYEVWAVMGGRLAEYEGHMARLERSLDELRIARPMGRAALTHILRETVRRNRVVEGLVYVQVTRGVAPRDHAFPDPPVKPSLVVTAKSLDRAAQNAKAAAGLKVITVPDQRWGRCDIKTVGLLPNALAKQAAREAGAAEAWMVDELGFVTEGASTNAWILDAEGVLRTRDTNANILRGVTRHSLIDVARGAGYPVEERPFTVEEAKAAREAFYTAASAFVSPVAFLDGAPIGEGRAGPVALKLRSLYMEHARNTAV